jgi:hypothetical protein
VAEVPYEGKLKLLLARLSSRPVTLQQRDKKTGELAGDFGQVELQITWSSMVTKKDLESKLSNEAQWKRSVVTNRVRQLQQCRGTLDLTIVSARDLRPGDYRTQRQKSEKLTATTAGSNR